MHYLALYRKYRPTNFEEVVGQEKVIDVIKNEVVNNRVSHAYLFSGPRGTGKTTTAKIIAKLVNCENSTDGKPCEKCTSCLNFKNSSDIVEIDAASNNGVDEIRELRDKVNLVPTSSKYKIYIIDEVHMLTTSAFNALLKTLEEPPAHVIFILATTEPHKIPLTISSRCQKFCFSKIDNDEIVRRLKTIVSCENLMVNDEILYEIARLSDGGLRDAINLLDQLIAYKSNDIQLDDLYRINGTVSYLDLYNFIIYLQGNEINSIISYIEKIDKEGINIAKFIEELIVFLKDVLLSKNANIQCEIVQKQEKIDDLLGKLSEDNIYNMIYAYNDTLNNIKMSNDAVILFIVDTLKIIKSNFKVKEEKVENKIEDKTIEKNSIDDKKLKDESDNSTNNVTIYDNKLSSDFIKTRINNTFALADKSDLIELKSKWNKLNDYLFDSNYAVNCGILKDTDVVAVGNDYAILTSKFDSIVDKINYDYKNYEETLKHIFSKKYNIVLLRENEWLEEKKKYIDDIKRGVKYHFIEEKENVENSNRTPVDDLIDIIGEDLIQYN